MINDPGKHEVKIGLNPVLRGVHEGAANSDVEEPIRLGPCRGRFRARRVDRGHPPPPAAGRPPRPRGRKTPVRGKDVDALSKSWAT
jgi:hypothetical protein